MGADIDMHVFLVEDKTNAHGEGGSERERERWTLPSMEALWLGKLRCLSYPSVILFVKDKTVLTIFVLSIVQCEMLSVISFLVSFQSMPYPSTTQH